MDAIVYNDITSDEVLWIGSAILPADVSNKGYYEATPGPSINFTIDPGKSHQFHLVTYTPTPLLLEALKDNPIPSGWGFVGLLYNYIDGGNGKILLDTQKASENLAQLNLVPAPAVPAPNAFLLLSTGLAGLAMLSRKRR